MAELSDALPSEQQQPQVLHAKPASDTPPARRPRLPRSEQLAASEAGAAVHAAWDELLAALPVPTGPGPGGAVVAATAAGEEGGRGGGGGAWVGQADVFHISPPSLLNSGWFDAYSAEQLYRGLIGAGPHFQALVRRVGIRLTRASV
jgi:hypothetical protein